MTKICFLEQPGKRSPDSVMPLTVERLKRLGCSVEVLIPERVPAVLRHLTMDADLYVWKSHERLCDSLAAQLHARGLPIINDYCGTLLVRDKIATSMRLMEAGLPTPEAYYASSVAQLRTVIEAYPVVVKPNAGRRGQQISVVRGPEELEKLDLLYCEVFAQQYIRGDGLDLKAYIIGDQVFGVARPFPVRTAEDKRGRPQAITPEVRDLCLRCGELLGQELYGVDLIESDDGPYVIEVNCFPGYKGVPEADRLLAEYIFDRAVNPASQKAPVSCFQVSEDSA